MLFRVIISSFSEGNFVASRHSNYYIAANFRMTGLWLYERETQGDILPL